MDLALMIGFWTGVRFLLLFFVAIVVKWLWNSTLPGVLGLATVTYWQAFKILLLCTFLFGSAQLLQVQFGP